MKIVENTQKTICYETTEKQETRTSFPLRIFALFFHPSTHVTAMGGAEKRFVETLKVFCEQDNVKIAVLESSPSLLDAPKYKCKKYSLPWSFHGKGWLSTYLEWGFWIFRALFKSLSILQIENPHVIFVTNNTLPNLILGYFVGLISHKPVGIIVHHIDIPSAKIGAKDSLYCSYRNIDYTRSVSLAKTLAFYITLSLLKKTNAIVAVSNFTAKALRDNGISKSKIFVSGNAINFDFISGIKPYRYEKIFDGVFAGRISKEKGIFNLVEAWKKVVKNKENVKLLIIGSGLELDSLKKMIAKDELEDNILIYGRCSDIKLYSLLKSSKVFIFPSLFEGWGIAVAEALACGLPVVAYDIPALRETFGSCKNVFLVPVGDIDRITCEVLELLNTTNGNLCEISRDYAKKFEWKKVAATDLEAIAKFASEVLNKNVD
ncbi:glycosyltransferase [Candidatus Bathyarchaeota archaeon]|nr:glycosyltransferase [Candidatus Bathyarchaeota archaeon]